MSTDYTAHIVYGTILTDEDFNKETPNPMWGKFKFDPETGEKVEKTIRQSVLDPYELEDDTLVIRDTGYGAEGKMVFGLEIIEAYSGTVCEIAPPSPSEATKLISKIGHRLEKFGISYEDRKFRLYLVFYVG